MRLALVPLCATTLTATTRPAPRSRSADSDEIRPTPVWPPTYPFGPGPSGHMTVAAPRPTRPEMEEAARG